MAIRDALLQEFDEEMSSTRKILERVPEDKFAWKPHEKSSTLGRLANHLAQIPLAAAAVIRGQAKRPIDVASKAELLELADQNIAAAREAISIASDQHLIESRSASLFFGMPRLEFLRRRVISHVVHHRGQLTVYLRLLDVAVPGMYGPSADEK